MNYTERSFLFFLVSSLLTAQDNLPNLMAARNYFSVPPSDRVSTGMVNDPALKSRGTFPAYMTSDTGAGSVRLVPAGLPVSFVPRTPVQFAWLRRDLPILLLPQASGTSTPTAQPAPAKPRYWTGRRVAILSVGLGLAGTGAAMWVNGKSLPNSNYNVNACKAALLSGGVGTGLNLSGDAAVGKYCNETTPSTGKKAGLVLMVVGGPVSLVSLLVHGL